MKGNRIIKRILSLFLVLSLMLSCVPMQLHAQETGSIQEKSTEIEAEPLTVSENEEGTGNQNPAVSENEAISFIKYTEGSAQEVTITEYTTVSSNTVDWKDGYYYVTGDVTINGEVTFHNLEGLILADDATLTINGGIKKVENGDSFIIYGEEGKTGVLKIKQTESETPAINGNRVMFHGVNVEINSRAVGIATNGGADIYQSTMIIESEGTAICDDGSFGGLLTIDNSKIELFSKGHGMEIAYNMDLMDTQGCLQVRGNTFLHIKSENEGSCPLTIAGSIMLENGLSLLLPSNSSIETVNKNSSLSEILLGASGIIEGWENYYTYNETHHWHPHKGSQKLSHALQNSIYAAYEEASYGEHSDGNNDGKCDVCSRRSDSSTELYIGSHSLAGGEYLNNKGHITALQPEDGYAYYKEGNLTLNNFNYRVEEDSAGVVGDVGICTEGVVNLKLTLQGTNTLALTAKQSTGIRQKYEGGSRRLLVEGNGSLAISGVSGYGIDTNSLTISSGKLAISSNGSAIRADNSMEMTGGELEFRVAGNGIEKGLGNSVIIRGGTYYFYSPSGAPFLGNNIVIMGGSFNFDPSSYLDPLYSATRQEDIWQVAARDNDNEVYVAGVGLESGDYLAVGAEAAVREKPKGGYAYYQDGTLTLSDYEIQGETYKVEEGLEAMIYTAKPLMIVLEGENRLVGKITDEEEATQLGIVVLNSSLTIEGTGSLTLENTFSIFVDRLTIRDCRITMKNVAAGILANEIDIKGRKTELAMEISGNAPEAMLIQCNSFQLEEELAIIDTSSGGEIDIEEAVNQDTLPGIIISGRKPNVIVGGVEMTEGQYLASGAATTTAGRPEGGYAYYEYGVLTLNGYDNEEKAYEYLLEEEESLMAAVCSNVDLEIILEGENQLSLPQEGHAILGMGRDTSFTFTGKGSLQLQASRGMEAKTIAMKEGSFSIAGEKGIIGENIAIQGATLDIISQKAGMVANEMLTITGRQTEILIKPMTEEAVAIQGDRELADYLIMTSLPMEEENLTATKISLKTGEKPYADIWVGGQRLEEGDYLTSPGEQIQKEKPLEGGFAYYKDGVLTLENYSYEGEGYEVGQMGSTPVSALIYSPDSLELVLQGENNLVSFGDSRNSYGIVIGEEGREGDLTISGNGSLMVRGDFRIRAGVKCRDFILREGIFEVTRASYGVISSKDFKMTGGMFGNSALEWGVWQEGNIIFRGGYFETGSGADFINVKGCITGGCVNFQFNDDFLKLLPEGYRVREGHYQVGNQVRPVYFIEKAAPAPLDQFYIEGEREYIYTGKAIKPDFQVYDGLNGLLKAGRDYTITYKNNIGVYTLTEGQEGFEPEKAPKAIIKGKGAYGQSLEVYFTIAPKDISDLTDDTIVAETLVLEENGKVQKKIPVITYEKKKLAGQLKPAAGQVSAKVKDFIYSYPDLEEEAKVGAYEKAGVWTILAEGTGNYTGSRRIQLIIAPKGGKMTSAKVGKIANKQYTGSAIELTEQELVVTGKVNKVSATLIKGTHYEVTYKNNKEIGTATVIITGIPENGFYGSKTATFKITGTSLTKAKIEGLTDKTFHGKEQSQQLTVSLPDSSQASGKKVLTEGEDYLVSYENNVNAGKAKLTIQGINSYTGTIKKTFKILPYDLTGETDKQGNLKPNSPFTESASQLLKREDGDYMDGYQKGGYQLPLQLFFTGESMTEGVDYTISYKNNKKVYTLREGEAGYKAGQAPTVTIKGKGNFKGSISKTFRIMEKSIYGDVTMYVADVMASSKKGGFISKPVLKDSDGMKLTEGKDYKVLQYLYKDETGDFKEVTKKDILNTPGTEIKVIVEGLGAYGKSVEGVPNRQEATYYLTKQSITKIKAGKITKAYTGAAITLTEEDFYNEDGSSKITIGSGANKVELKYGVDFTVLKDSYQNNVKKGTAKVTLVGNPLNEGNNVNPNAYAGEKTITFKIESRSFGIWNWLEELLSF